MWAELCRFRFFNPDIQAQLKCIRLYFRYLVECRLATLPSMSGCKLHVKKKTLLWRKKTKSCWMKINGNRVNWAESGTWSNRNPEVGRGFRGQKGGPWCMQAERRNCQREGQGNLCSSRKSASTEIQDRKSASYLDQRVWQDDWRLWGRSAKCRQCSTPRFS